MIHHLQKLYIFKHMKHIVDCHLCNEKFQSQLALSLHFKSSNDILHNHFIYNETNIDEWIECKICGIRKPSIIKHILQHGLTVLTYKNEVNSEEHKKLLEQKQKQKRNAFEFECKICFEKFSTEKALNRHLIVSKDIEHSHFIYNETNVDEWIECKICGFRRSILEKHLKSEHGLNSEEYKQKYNAKIYCKNYFEQLKKFSLIGTNTPRKEKEKKIECKICQQKFSTKYQLQQHIKSVQDKEHSHLIFNETNINEWVECKVCSYRSKRIDIHIKNKHNLTLEQYKGQYQGNYLSNLFLEKSKIGSKINHESDRWSGEKNPFYGKHHSEKVRKQISIKLLSKKDRKKVKIILALQKEEKLKKQNETLKEILFNYEKMGN